MRGLGSIPTRGNILSLDFFHIVKPPMLILALLPMLCVCENPTYAGLILDMGSIYQEFLDLTKIHSSRMCTVHCSGRPRGGGGVCVGRGVSA